MLQWKHGHCTLRSYGCHIKRVWHVVRAATENRRTTADDTPNDHLNLWSIRQCETSNEQFETWLTSDGQITPGTRPSSKTERKVSVVDHNGLLPRADPSPAVELLRIGTMV